MARVAMTVNNHVDGGQKAKELLSVSSAQQLWDEWELQCLVLASFSLQAFFLFAAGIRQRNKSAALRILLWLAYLSADYVAIFVLGHLTLKMDEPRHQLVLLWAPVLLLHLGGQETITAFSMEDNELWKRHLLGLLTQVAMAVYVVAKSWRTSDGGLLVAPVALMFVSGTVKYAERTWALKTATSDAIKDSRMSDLYETMKTRQQGEPPAAAASASSSSSAVQIQRYNQDIVGRQKWWLQEEYADLVQAAGDSFPNCLNTLMDIPVAPWLLPQIWGMIGEIQRLRGPATRAAGAGGRGNKDTFPSRAYKLGEIQLSLMYDHLYTKVGLRYAQRWPVVGLGLPLLTLATTSSALALFAAAATRKGSGASYSAVDVVVSYVLLGGAVALEVLSILAVTLSFRSYCFLRDKLGAGGRLTPAVFRLVRFLRPYHRPLWSNKWAQYNLLAGCIKEKQAGVLARAMRCVGLAGDTELRRISDETKALICNELDDRRRLSKFSHARGTEILLLSGHGERSPLHKSIAKVDFSTSVVMWHIVTDMCFFLGGKPDDAGSRHQALAREVSNYLMDLVMERRVLISSEGHVAHRKARDEVKQILAGHEAGAKVLEAGDADAMRKLLEAGVPTISDPAEMGAPEGVDMVFATSNRSYETMRPVLPRAWRLAQLLLLQGRGTAETGGGAPPWEMIASVWVEMLFHLATRCEAGFHTKNLSTGGEFITHVRFLLLNRGIGWNFILGRA